MTQEQKVTQERNARRRERYHTDDSYRQEVNQRNRQNYREQSGGVELRDCSDNLSILKGLGTVRLIPATGDEILTFSSKEVAEVLDGYTDQFVYRCLKDGRFPPMGIEAEEEVANGRGTRKAAVMVYSEGEMRGIAEVMANHQKEYSYYRKSHTATTDALYAAVAEFRG